MDSFEFEKLYKSYYLVLCNYIYFMCKDKELANDIVQEVMMKIWNQHKTIVLKKGIKKYLYACCYNKMVDTLKKSTSVSLDYLQLKNEIVEKINEYDEAEFEFKRVLLETAIRELPVKTREIFIWVKINGYSHKKVAHILDVSVRSIDNQIANALKKIKESVFRKLENKKAV